MRELFELLSKLEDKMDCCNYLSIKIFSDGSGNICDIDKVMFHFNDIKVAIDWLRKKTKKEEYFDFGTKFTIDMNRERPLYIAYSEANEEDALQTLLVNPNYDVEVIPNYCKNKTALKFKNNVK